MLSKVRWHLVKRDGSWAIFDLEDLEFGFGVLGNVGVGLLEVSQGIPASWRGVSRRIIGSRNTGAS